MAEKKVTKMTIRILMLLSLILAMNVNISIVINNPINAETGKGTDIFKVIMTIFGVENSKGDIVAIVTVNNGEESRVKFLETEAFKPVPSNLTSLVVPPDADVQTIEYVATFPNITVSAGKEYKACILTTSDLELICETGYNSPASRPEFVDLTLDADVTGLEDISTQDQ